MKTNIGRIALPDASKQEAFMEAIALGPEVKKVQAGDKLITIPLHMVKYETEENTQNEIKAFVKEEHIIAIIRDKKTVN